MIELDGPVNFDTFDPTYIPYQHRVVWDVYNRYDYGHGFNTVVSCGSVGSSKTLLSAHLGVRHLIENNGARCLLARRSLPDLRDTLFQDIVEHIEDSSVKDYIKRVNHSSPRIEFTNGSEFIYRTWADKKYNKVRSLKLSMAIVEELTEHDDDDDEQFIDQVFARMGRIPHVKQNLVMLNMNADSPSHWVYRRFFEQDKPRTYRYKSLTHQNPFLPDWYIENLKEQYDPKMVRRMLFAEWIEISGDVIYYMYDQKNNFKKEKYKPTSRLPLHLSWDFNCADGKPYSSVAFQYDAAKDEFYIFDEVVVDGLKTLQSCEEWDEKGYFSGEYHIVVNGDCNGRNKDTRNNRSDYDIIKRYLSNHKNNLRFDIKVPNSNPALKKRWNLVNGYCENANGKHRLFVYETAPTADKALRLTQKKKGSSLQEDDSKAEQHIGTAIGYGICSTIADVKRKPQRTVAL